MMLKLENLSYADSKRRMNIEEPPQAAQVHELLEQCSQIMKSISGEEEDLMGYKFLGYSKSLAGI